MCKNPGGKTKTTYEWAVAEDGDSMRPSGSPVSVTGVVQ